VCCNLKMYVCLCLLDCRANIFNNIISNTISNSSILINILQYFVGGKPSSNSDTIKSYHCRNEENRDQYFALRNSAVLCGVLDRIGAATRASPQPGHQSERIPNNTAIGGIGIDVVPEDLWHYGFGVSVVALDRRSFNVFRACRSLQRIYPGRQSDAPAASHDPASRGMGDERPTTAPHRTRNVTDRHNVR
jgi:hypothetical protein